MNTRKLWIAFSLFVITVFSQVAFAQGLNWEGQTGALITPFAYTASSPARKFGKPEVSFHYLNSGDVIGNDYQFSITEGFAKRFEVGYTAAFSSAGNSPLSYLFSNGFNEFHGKVTIVDENARKTKWVPAIAVGALGRTGVQRVGQVVKYWNGANPAASKSTTNGDFYIVATKTVTQFKVPFLLSVGEKVTNASVFGVAGNSPSWRGRLFGTAAVVVKGPAKSLVVLGSEVSQQPRYVEGLGTGATIPTSLGYFVRVVPHLEGAPLQLDLGVAQLAGKIAPGVDLQARARVGMGISYHF
ncbi:MAG TPA: hypothetical protein VM578_05250 [Candidatus Saccharimonadales bacterium]|nr:hypothetical protein [Candidatus Saccharimonadales bacterium]